MRLYTIGDKQFGFEVVTDKVDYRDDVNTYVISATIPEDEALKVKELIKKLNLNFSAAISSSIFSGFISTNLDLAMLSSPAPVPYK